MTWVVHEGDAIDVLRGMPEESIDAVVTDPPYGLGFMGRTWDDSVPVADAWAEILRVARPGAHLLAFGGTKRFHRAICAIEDAGWEIRDTIMWVYGSGFPKSRNLDGEWAGFGTNLKPSWEPITVARKPFLGSVEGNIALHGCGAINIDACRVGADDVATARSYVVKRFRPGADQNATGETHGDVEFRGTMKAGRWPANLVHDGSDDVVSLFPADAGAASPVTRRGSDKFRTAFGSFRGQDEVGATFQGDHGSASRFYYCAKASPSERGSYNLHPTVKPLALMRWLCTLVTPPGGTILDPYCGSGSTGVAALAIGASFVGIEREPDYVAIARARIATANSGDTRLDDAFKARLAACESDPDVPPDQAKRLALAQATAAVADSHEQLALWGDR